MKPDTEAEGAQAHRLGMRYWKATRLDGTDFWRGTTDYGQALESGAVLEHPKRFKRNDPMTYFSVAIVPTDCAGMEWPCRLFRVEPVGRAWRNDGIPNKRCCSRLRVVEELPAHEALGPQGQEVAALIDRVGRLTAAEINGLGIAWRAAWGAAQGAAWGAARAAAQEAAQGAAWGAAALLTRDLITPEQFDVLYGPWKEVIGDDDA